VTADKSKQETTYVAQLTGNCKSISQAGEWQNADRDVQLQYNRTIAFIAKQQKYPLSQK